MGRLPTESTSSAMGSLISSKAKASAVLAGAVALALTTTPVVRMAAGDDVTHTHSYYTRIAHVEHIAIGGGSYVTSSTVTVNRTNAEE